MTEVPMHKHSGSACPCHPEAMITVTYACGYNSGKPLRAGSLRWSQKGDPFDIAEFAVLDVPEEFRG